MSSLVKNINGQDFWGTQELKKDQMYHRQIGNLNVWLVRDIFELRIAYSHIETESTQGSDNKEAPENLIWQRWALRQKEPVIEFRPVFPDRPVVVQPEAQFRVAEDARVRIFIRVPIWLQVVLKGNPQTTLLDVPTIKLSNTWFGDFQSGELCYWISSGSRRSIEADDSRPYLSICPLQLIDQSPEDLDVQKICLRVKALSMFYDGDQLWADETTVRFKGMTEVSQIDVAGKAPDESKGAKMVSKPRQESKRALRLKTFSTIKDLPGMGLFVK